MKTEKAKPAVTAPAVAQVDELRQLGAEIELQGAPATEEGSAPAGSPAPAASEAPAVDPSAMTPEAAADIAAGVWTQAFDLVELGLPFVKFPQVTRVKAVEKTVPVILKHQDKLPWWYKKYREEIDLGIFVGLIIYNCTRAYLVAKRIEEQAKQPQAGQPTAATESSTAPAS